MSLSVLTPVHAHGLVFARRPAQRMCDVCRVNITADAYQCKPCDFDVCMSCMGKYNTGGKSDMLRDPAFLESLALAVDRTVPLKELIPDSDEAYFMHTLLAQQLDDKDRERKLIEALRESRWANTNKANELELRYMLRRYKDASSDEQLAIATFLADKLYLRFNHAREVQRGEAPKQQYPTKLDASRIATEGLLQTAFKNNRLHELTQLSYPWLAKQTLSNAQLADLLSRLARPTLPNLVDLIVTDLRENKQSFGTRGIHRQLTLAQLEELQRKAPEKCESDQNFITEVMIRQQPSLPLDQLALSEQEAFWQSQWVYQQALPPVFNGIRALVMYRALAFWADQGQYPFDRFREYLQLPWRHTFPHVDRFSDKPENRGRTIHWASTHVQIGVLRPIGGDQDLVKLFLTEWFRRPENTTINAWHELLDSEFLTRLLATVKVTLPPAPADEKKGAEADEKAKAAWFAMLGSQAQEVREIVDIEWARENLKTFPVDGEVVLDVWVKNVPSLVVKVFKINTLGYYRSKLAEVDSSINLDGLTPHEEATLNYENISPLARIRRRLTLSSLANTRGVFVVELLGNGKRARAVLRKGQISFLEHQAAIGHVFRLFDEAGQPIKGSIWINGHTYTSDAKTGLIVAPYTNSPNSAQRMILTNEAGDFSSFATFSHMSESYSFRAGLYVDREALLQKSKAELVVRPSLFLNDLPVALDNIRKCTLKIDSRNDENVSTSQSIEDFKLYSDKEAVHTFNVPDNVRAMTFTVTIEVRVRSTNSTQTLSDSHSIELNSIDNSGRLDDLHLRLDATSGYSIYLLGKAGEPRPHRHLALTFQHAHVTSSTRVDLQTDFDGRVLLGFLPGVTSVSVHAALPGGSSGAGEACSASWPIHTGAQVVSRPVVHAKEGGVIRIPYAGAATSVTLEHFSLLERRGGKYRADLTLSNLTLVADGKDKAILIKGLKQGRYSLQLNEFVTGLPGQAAVTEITVAAGPLVMTEFVMEKDRFVQLRERDGAELSIASVRLEASAAKGDEKKGASGDIVVQLAGHTPTSRVHLISSHFMPEYSLYQELTKAPVPSPRVTAISRLLSVYLGQRNLGDEHQYILHRKQAAKAVGNMLAKPSLLLNERMRRETSFAEDPKLRGSEAFASVSAAPMERMLEESRSYDERERSRDRRSRSIGGAFLGGRGGRPGMHQTRNIEFLSDPSTRLLNLKPDAAGVVRIARSQLGQFHTFVLAVAVDGPSHAATAQLALPAYADESKAERVQTTTLNVDAGYRDTRLIPGLDPRLHVTEQYLVSTLQAGQTQTIDDIKTAKVETYDALGDVFALYRTLSTGSSDGALLLKFDWLMDWPNMSEEKKQAKYSESACHELNFFVFCKDRPFFDSVVKPFLAHKLQKTFLDRWFLDMDISAYAQPFVFEKLNAVEQLLLASTMPGLLKAVTKSFSDRGALQRADPQAFVQLFKAALESRALDTAAKGLVPKQDRAELVTEKQHLLKQMAYAAAPPPPAPMAMRAMAMAAPAPMPAMAMSMAAPRALMARSMPAAGAMKKMKEMSRKRMEVADEEEEAMSSDADDADLGADSFDSLVGGLPQEPIRQLYRDPPSTKEYEERAYYAVPADDINAMTRLVGLNAFWVDYAAHIAEEKKGAFLSKNFIQIGLSFTEMVFALSVLGLPFKGGDHETSGARAGKFTLKAATPMIVFHKEIKETPTSSSAIAISQKYFDPNDQFEELPDGERSDKYLSTEFLANKTYGCRIILTNVSSTRQRVEVLMEIPQGAIPLGMGGRAGFSTRTTFQEIGSFSTNVIEYLFYFPALGAYNHYPVHVSKTGTVVGFGQPTQLHVVAKPTTPPDLTSWNVVSQNGTEEQVLAFLREQNVHKLNLSMIAWRLKSKPFFQQVLTILRGRRAFDATVWSYSLLHNEADAMREYLPYTQLASTARVGPYLRSWLLEYDIEAYPYRNIQHLEYSPLINSRAHQLRAAGDPSSSRGVKPAPIQNREFREHYKNFLDYILYRIPSIAAASTAHLLEATYYLLLQDRVEEAQTMFKRIDPARVREEGKRAGNETEAVLQYDYLTAFLDFYNPDGPKLAGAIAKKYKNYPIAKKRALFEEIEQQLLEAEPNAITDAQLDDEKASREREMDNLASTEPSLDFAIEGGKIELAYQNIKEVTVNFYVMDIELLFSTQPFLKEDSSAFLSVCPNHSFTVSLADKKVPATIDIPAQFKTSNVYIELLGAGVSKSKSFFGNTFNVQVLENYGQVKATDKSSRPLPAAYVKVYARLNDGSVDFYKDGYTDRRGRFDYASLSTNKLGKVDKFSILIMADGLGSVVREAGKPAT